MDLTITERLLLLTILPKRGDLLTIRIVRKLREALSFSEAEIEEYAITQQDGHFSWRGDDPAPIEMGAKARQIVVNALTQLDADGKVEERFLTLFDKFGVGLD